MATENPLLQITELPQFSKIKAEHALPALKEIILECRNIITAVADEASSKDSWSEVCYPLYKAEARLQDIFSPVRHLSLVKDSPEFREAVEKCQSEINEYSTWRCQHQGLFHAIQRVKNSSEFQSTSQAERKSVEKDLRDFKLAGLDLPEEDRKRYGILVKEISELETKFQNNVLDAVMGWTKLVTSEDQLAGLSKNVIDAARERAQNKGHEVGWLFTLDAPSVQPVLKTCESRPLRQEIFEAFNTRASDQGPNAGKWDNTNVMVKMLKLKHELATLLGFENIAAHSLATKMAENTETVTTFLNNLVERSYDKAGNEMKQLQQFATEQCGFMGKLEPWDIAFYSEKQREKLFSISDELLKVYFPEDKVIGGLFEVLRRLYGVKVEQRTDVDVWDPSVRFYQFKNEETGELRGSLYMDLYAREYKQGGAWMGTCISPMRFSDGTIQRPVAYLTCNFSKPVGDIPALLTHNDVETLFHECGHCLHHILTEVYVPSVSGTNVPWDAVEHPSQFHEFWCWQPEALAFLSGHYKTGESLPKETLEKMLAAKNYQKGLFLNRQLVFGLFDWTLHLEYNPQEADDAGEFIMACYRKVEKAVAVAPRKPWQRFPHAFAHIFGGEYTAGYYSYLWAEVLAADSFSRFKEEGIFNRETGRSFHDNILSQGHVEEPGVLFKRFRGRDAQIGPLLREYDIVPEVAVAD